MNTGLHLIVGTIIETFKFKVKVFKVFPRDPRGHNNRVFEFFNFKAML